MNFRSPQFAVRTGFTAAVFAVALLATATAQSSKTTDTPAVPQASTQASPFGGTVVEDVIARVNDQIISRSDYERAEQELEERARQQNMTPQQVEAERKDLLRDLIDQQLLLSKGKELDITGESELIRELNDIRKQNHLDTMEDLQKAAESQGVNYEDFKANIRNRIITQQVIRDEVGRHLNITQADVQRYYQQHKDEFSKPESVHLDEIMVPVADPAAAAAALAKADGYEARLKAGGDFDSLVKESTAGSATPMGGDLGSFTRGKLPKVLEDQTFALKTGQFTEPIRTRQGYIILKVLEHNAGGPQPFKDVQPQVEDALAQERVQPAVRAYLAQARMEAYVVYKPGYVDTAAVVNPNSILYSAYTPPPAKKKKKTVRTRYRGRASRSSNQTASAPAATGPVAPAGIPTLADAPHSQAATGDATATAAATTPAGIPATTTVAAETPAGKTRESNRKRAAKDTTVASTMKPGKKEKIRFGQAPRETLPTNDNTRNVDAHANADTSTGNAPGTSLAPPTNEVAAADIQEPAAPKAEKKRFSDRAKLPKPKKVEGAQPVNPLTPAPATAEETATQKLQDQPLGLAGDTTKPAKKKKVKPTEKTRLQDTNKQPLSTSGQPAATTTPDQTTPTSTGAPAAPLETNPVQTPPTNTQGVPTPGEGNGTTPPPPPQ